VSQAYYRNLVPGQFQIGNIVMGRGTTIAVEEFEPQPYDINQQDFQTSRSDEMRFGQDQLKPTTINLKMHVLNNKLLEQYEYLNPNFWKDMPTADDLGTIWRNDDKGFGRKVPGSMIPLYYCGADGIAKTIYGRPGKFAKTPDPTYKEWVQCLGEFRRADTLAYSPVEYVTPVIQNAAPVNILRTKGNVETWCRFILEGPLVNPSLTIGEQQVKLNVTIPDGDIVEISSYPWQRRVVNNSRVNLSAALSGNMIYLDRMTIPYNELTAIRWTDDNTNTFQPALGNHSWVEDIDNGNIFDRTLPNTFQQMWNKVVVRFDLFNETGPKKFIGSGLIENRSACLYTATKYATQDQYCEASIVEPWAGRSAMVIMSNATMTNYAMLEVVSGSSGILRIRTGTAPTAWSGILGTPYSLGRRWSETDRVAFGYDPTTNQFRGYLNGTQVTSWTDTSNVVGKTSLNRQNGYIFDMDANLTTFGTGFGDIVCYDRATVPTPTGSIRMLWRDAWSTL
jgi:hypothetical protein